MTVPASNLSIHIDTIPSSVVLQGSLIEQGNVQYNEKNNLFTLTLADQSIVAITNLNGTKLNGKALLAAGKTEDVQDLLNTLSTIGERTREALAKQTGEMHLTLTFDSTMSKVQVFDTQGQKQLSDYEFKHQVDKPQIKNKSSEDTPREVNSTTKTPHTSFQFLLPPDRRSSETSNSPSAAILSPLVMTSPTTEKNLSEKELENAKLEYEKVANSLCKTPKELIGHALDFALSPTHDQGIVIKDPQYQKAYEVTKKYADLLAKNNQKPELAHQENLDRFKSYIEGNNVLELSLEAAKLCSNPHEVPPEKQQGLYEGLLKLQHQLKEELFNPGLKNDITKVRDLIKDSLRLLEKGAKKLHGEAGKLQIDVKKGNEAFLQWKDEREWFKTEIENRVNESAQTRQEIKKTMVRTKPDPKYLQILGARLDRLDKEIHVLVNNQKGWIAPTPLLNPEIVKLEIDNKMIRYRVRDKCSIDLFKEAAPLSELQELMPQTQRTSYTDNSEHLTKLESDINAPDADEEAPTRSFEQMAKDQEARMRRCQHITIYLEEGDKELITEIATDTANYLKALLNKKNRLEKTAEDEKERGLVPAADLQLKQVNEDIYVAEKDFDHLHELYQLPDKATFQEAKFGSRG